MRILAIRGCNLASLAGEFEIDLARGPLGAAGVFAIVGNTGAGKSTLLDALCVALFDRTPRLTNHSRVQVGRGADDPLALGAQDVRTLLRRGAAQGWAEVDFESGDARRYRARWSVRRARGQADGTIQAQQVTLIALDGNERLGGTKTETLEAIHARLGLTFDQFRRSALLAQGEFAAFLRADGKDRSELLERMTGTEIYSRLSVRAHVRASLAEQSLAQGRTYAHAIAVLGDDARRDAERELLGADEAKAAARKRFEAAERAARWSREASVRTDALLAAQRTHAAAQQAIADAEVDRAEVALRRRAETLRGPWEEAARADRQLAIARGEVHATGETARLALETQAAQVALRDELAALLAPLREARIAAGLVEQRGADPRAAEADTFARAAAEDAAWVQARVALAPEVAQWSELDARFAQLAVAADAVVAVTRMIAEQRESRGKVAAARVDAGDEVRKATERHAEAQRKVDAFTKKRGTTLEAARKAEDEARRRKADVEQLLAVASAARQARAARDEIDRQLAEAAAHAAADADLRATTAATHARALIVRTERTRIVEELRKAAGYEHARTELVDGEPCPLCGADEHPWRDRGALDEVIAASAAHLAEVSAELDAATKLLAQLDARAVHRTAEQGRLTKQRATALASVEAAAPTWADQLSALGELSLVADPTTPEAERLATELHAAATKGLEAARATRSQTEAATKAAADAQAEVTLCQQAVDQAVARVAELDRRLADVDATIGRLDGECAGRTERHAELTRELDAAIARWLAADPDAALAPGGNDRLHGGAATLGADRSHGGAAPALGSGGRSHGGAAARARGRSLAPTHDDFRAWMSELAAAWRTRTDKVARAEAAVAAAHAAADRDARESERSVAEHAARHAAAQQRKDELTGVLRTASDALAAAREGTGFDDDALQRLLAADASRLDALVARLAALDHAALRDKAIVVERERLVAEHAAARPADLFYDVVDEAQLTHLSALAAEAEKHAARLAAALAADADARVRREQALQQLALAEGEASVDRILGEVIGSHDGKAFRSFAQSLTLDGLLSVANSHLEELAPRYQLQRVPRHDLELQVIDRDLGDEVRSVQSLSGGESFLVSLALALGLSSMSAHDVRVRTLLIDEGFGTLDPTTLEMALSVLEALRQQGRQVGVISHVPQLVERVGAHVRVVARGGGRSEVIVA